MRSPTTLLVLLLAGCGSRPAATSRAPDAAPVVSAACQAARDTRSKAAELDRGGHELLALAKLDEANASCPAERASTLSLEASLLASTGGCARARALDPGGDAKAVAAVKDAKATCDAREAPSAGTAASMRGKMREAWAAELAKDWARAKGLYLDAWKEQHPNARALEDAARMAGRAGDAAESRRLRDRALIEAEATEHATGELSNRVRVARGAPTLRGSTLTLAEGGKVVARDLDTGELRVLLDAGNLEAMGLSWYGTLAFGSPPNVSTFRVFDLLTGAMVLEAKGAARITVSADDALVAVRDQSGVLAEAKHSVRVFDAATGEVRNKITGAWNDFDYAGAFAFVPDAAHLMILGDGDANAYRQWDVAKGIATSVSLSLATDAGGASGDGHFFAWVEGGATPMPLHVRDMVTNKDVATWTGNFGPVETIAVAPDGKTIATGSYNSLRLWDVHDHKQTFKHESSRVGGWFTNTRDSREYAFSDDGKTLVLAGRGLAKAWDVATGAEKPLVSDQSVKKVRRVVPIPGQSGVALVLEDEVQIVPASGEPRTVCVGMKPLYSDMIGPVNAAFSASGKSFACAMADGWVHVLDTSAYKEQAVIKKAAHGATADRPVDLVFSADDKALTVIGDAGFVTYDAQTAAQTAKVTFAHAKVGLAPRHARFRDGTLAVRTWDGSLAIYGADGVFSRDVKLPAGVPMDARDAFSADAKTYAVAVGNVLHAVDLTTGEDHPATLPGPAKTVAVSDDGAAAVVVVKDGTVLRVEGGEARAVPRAAKATAAWFAGTSIDVLVGTDTIQRVPASGDPIVLEVDAGGVVARDASGGFDVRGKPELECVVGKTFLSRETCADRAKDGLIPSWLAP